MLNASKTQMEAECRASQQQLQETQEQLEAKSLDNERVAQALQDEVRNCLPGPDFIIC